MIGPILGESFMSTLVTASSFLSLWGFYKNSENLRRRFHARFGWKEPPVEDAEGMIRFAYDNSFWNCVVGILLWIVLHLLILSIVYSRYIFLAAIPELLICLYILCRKIGDVVLTPYGIYHQGLKRYIETDRLGWNEIDHLEPNEGVDLILKDRTRSLHRTSGDNDVNFNLDNFKNGEQLEQAIVERFEMYHDVPAPLCTDWPTIPDPPAPIKRSFVIIPLIGLIVYCADFGCFAITAVYSTAFRSNAFFRNFDLIQDDEVHMIIARICAAVIVISLGGIYAASRKRRDQEHTFLGPG